MKVKLFSVTHRLIELIQGMTEDQQLLLLNELEQTQFNGKRVYNRSGVVSDVYFTAEGQYSKNSIKDISAGGLFIETDMELEIGQKITMVFTLPGKNKQIKIGGEVVRNESNGVGVRFKEGDEEMMIL